MTATRLASRPDLEPPVSPDSLSPYHRAERAIALALRRAAAIRANTATWCRVQAWELMISSGLSPAVREGFLAFGFVMKSVAGH